MPCTSCLSSVAGYMRMLCSSTLLGFCSRIIHSSSPSKSAFCELAMPGGILMVSPLVARTDEEITLYLCSDGWRPKMMLVNSRTRVSTQSPGSRWILFLTNLLGLMRVSWPSRLLK
nr:MAG: hypothetical protein [Molluscum contagiosum virus]